MEEKEEEEEEEEEEEHKKGYGLLAAFYLIAENLQ